jgi:hypothetical protein
MTADYNVSCSSAKYRFGFIWACVMVAVYPLGCPLFYFWLLFRVRHEIQTRGEEKLESEMELSQQRGDEEASCDSSIALAVTEKVRTKQEVLRSLRFLYESYEPRYWWWEIVETSQRLVLTGVLVLISQGSAVQIIVGAVLTLLFLHLYAKYEPFSDSFVLSIKVVSFWQIFFVFWIALLIKADFPSIGSRAVGICLVLIIFANIFLDVWKACRTTITSRPLSRWSHASVVKSVSISSKGGSLIGESRCLPMVSQTEMNQGIHISAETSSSPLHLTLSEVESPPSDK